MVKPVKFTRDSGCPARDEFLVINVVHILAVIPATSCSAERSFSALRRLKTYLRNTMGQQRVSNVHRTTVLCKSNANEMREFHSLFPRLFVESTRENSSRNSRCLERQFAKTKADISTNFRYLNDNSRSIALIRKSIYEISLRTKWLFVLTLKGHMPTL